MSSLDSLDAINQKIAELENQKNALSQEIDSHKKNMEAELRRIADQLGYTLVAKDKSKLAATTGERTRKPAKVKYRDENGNAWTGRGMTPRWVKAAEENGKSRDSFLV